MAGLGRAHGIPNLKNDVTMRTTSPWFTAALLTVLVATLNACDSGDPAGNPDPGDVAGVYSFSELTFYPSGAGFQPIAVLDTLVQSETSLRLATSGEFILSYQFFGGDLFFADGEFSVSLQSVRLNADNDDRVYLEGILLNDDLNLRRSDEEPDVLRADISKTINPSEFSDRYAGVEEMSGTLRVRAERD